MGYGANLKPSGSVLQVLDAWRISAAILGGGPIVPPQRLEPMYGGMPPYREPDEGPHCQSGNRRQEKVRLGMAWNRVWAVPGPGDSCSL